jgi:hypothetical protein
MEVEPGVVVDTDTGVAPEPDVERFLEEIEEDAEMRSHINLYRKPSASFVSAGDVSDSELPQVPLEELLDDLCIADTLPGTSH